MAINLIDAISGSVRILIAAVLAGHSIRRMKNGRFTTPLLFYCLSMIAIVLSDMYWLLNLLLIKDSRLPFFNASDIAVIGLFVLLGTSCKNMLVTRQKPPVGLMVFGMIWVALNIYVWYSWEGRIFNELLYGAALAYFQYMVMRLVSEKNAMTIAQKITLNSLAGLGLVLSFMLLHAGDSLYAVFDLLSGVELIISVLYLFVLYFRVLKADRDRANAIAFLCYLGSQYAMFLLSDIYYIIAETLGGISCILIFTTLERKEEHA